MQEDHKEDWVSVLDGVLFAYRTARHSSTGFSPFKLLYGREPKLPVDVTSAQDSKLTGNLDDEFSDKYVKHVSEVMTDLQNVVNSRAHAAIEKLRNVKRRRTIEDISRSMSFNLAKWCYFEI